MLSLTSMIFLCGVILFGTFLNRNVHPILVTREKTLRLLSGITPGIACGPAKVAGKNIEIL